MIPGAFRFEALGVNHDRAVFGCGDDMLDRYFQTQATQDIRRRIANCFVVVDTTVQAAALHPVGGQHPAHGVATR